MNRCFFLRLAMRNVTRGREVYLPYFIATTIISGAYFLMFNLLFSPGLADLQMGNTTRAIFAMGISVFSVFLFFFMLYINSFLIKRRKKEFGLYGVLGLNKSHVSRVLLWENLFVLGGGTLVGMGFAAAFGRLVFLLLLRVIRVSPNQQYVLTLWPTLGTAFMFGAVYVVTSIVNLVKVRLANPVELMNSERRGEKDSNWVWPLSLIGVGGLGFSYYMAVSTLIPAASLAFFFPLVLVVIVATYALFNAGSIAVLRMLRGWKNFYYKPGNFVTVSGMFHRMRQNANGLATISILSTMLLVTVGGSTALYVGQEEQARAYFPFDALVLPANDDVRVSVNMWREFDSQLSALARINGLEISNAAEQLEEVLAQSDKTGQAIIDPQTRCMAQLEHTLLLGMPGETTWQLAFNINGGTEQQCLNFMEAVNRLCGRFNDGKTLVMGNDFYHYRESGYAVFGGLIFLGAFFTILFLAVTVLIIYFKQITEGYEDKERFAILQKVGMDLDQVRSVINRQVLIVFFLPLMVALIHTGFGSVMVMRMFILFSLNDPRITFGCFGCAAALFVLTYLVVYRMTSRAYLRIVQR